MSDLILVPTPGERSRIEAELQSDASRWPIETIGFGAVASGVGAVNAIAKHSPSRVILAGIAGLFESHADHSLEIGNARWFDTGWIDGIGVGRGDQFQSAERLGWNWFSDPCESNHDVDEKSEEACLRYELPRGAESAGLLTVCAASEGASDARWRAQRFPLAIAEDMESFSVAYACKTAGVPLCVVRGLSNFVGQRDQSEWRIEEALANVAAELKFLIDEAK